MKLAYDVWVKETDVGTKEVYRDECDRVENHNSVKELDEHLKSKNWTVKNDGANRTVTYVKNGIKYETFYVYLEESAD